MIPKFEVVVSLPASTKGSKPRQFELLETNLPLFEHQVGSIEAFYFDRINLASSNSPIDAEVTTLDGSELLSCY
jgi:hypothetical protein